MVEALKKIKKHRATVGSNSYFPFLPMLGFQVVHSPGFKRKEQTCYMANSRGLFHLSIAFSIYYLRSRFYHIPNEI